MKRMPKGKRTMSTFSVYVPQEKGGSEVLKRLRALAKREGKSVSSLALEAILAYLKVITCEQETACLWTLR